jgi:hypothetical protein
VTTAERQRDTTDQHPQPCGGPLHATDALSQDGNAVDSRLSPTALVGHLSACPSNTSLHDSTDDGDGRDSQHTASARGGEEKKEDGVTTGEFPTTLLTSTPMQQLRRSWHELGGGGLPLGNSITQLNAAAPPLGRVCGPQRGQLTSATPTLLFSPPSSYSLVSVHEHDHTYIKSLMSPPRSGPLFEPSTAATAAAAVTTAAQTGHSPRKQHQQYRLNSAQARRVVVSRQRHRKLFELNEGDAQMNSEAEQHTRGRDDDNDDEEKLSRRIASDVSTGWMAALSSPPPTRVHPSHVEGNFFSTHTGLSRSITSPSSSAPFSSNTAGGAATSSSVGATGYSSANVTAAPHALLSHSLGSVGPSSHQSTRSSLKTLASLTSLQHRLWQHTVSATTPTTHVTAVSTATTRNGSNRGRGKTTHSLPPLLPPSPPPPALPGLPRTTAATISQLRQGQYITVPTSQNHLGNAVEQATAAAHNCGALAPHSCSYPPASLGSSRVPVTQWGASLMNERTHGRQGMQLAQWLVQRLLTTSPSTNWEFRNDGGNGSSSRNLDEEGADDASGGGGGGLLRSLAERGAVAAYLLSTLFEDGLPRHQQSVVPYVRMLIEFAFVPDTPTVRKALGTGTVQDEALLDRLALHHRCSIPVVAGTAKRATAAATSTTLPMSNNTAQPPSAQPPDVGDEEVMTVDLTDLLAPSFTRKTYITAHFELSGMTVGLAHKVRCRELHQRNVPRLLELTHKKWMRGLMRAVLRAWRHLCQERRVQEQRQRARWALRWTSERMRISLRRWRGYAALTLQMAEADSVAKAALSQKRGLIERLENEAAAMLRSSQQLQETLQRQDEQRDALEATISEREIVYQRLLRQVREVDRVGSLMLNSLLLAKTPPRFGDASTIAALMSTPMSHAGSHRGSLPSTAAAAAEASSGSDNNGDDDKSDGDTAEPQPSHLATALPSLLQWAKDSCGAAERAFLALYPGDAVEEAEEGEEEVVHDTKTGNGEKYDAAARAVQPPITTGATHVPPQQRQQQNPADAGSTVTSRTPADFDALLFSAASEVKLSDAPMGETVLVPLHKLLLLMRGCSGSEEEGGAAADEAAATKADRPLTTAGGRGGGGEGENGDVDAAVAPSLGIIRTVQCADAEVLREAHALLDRHSAALSNDYAASSPSHAATASDAPVGNDDADTQPSGVPLLSRLSAERRDTLQRICRVVIDAYEQLTGTTCVVTAEQLFERSRGTLLVFLAALLRHFTNWMVRRTQQTLPTTVAAPTVATSCGSAMDDEGSTSAGVVAMSAKQRPRKTNSEGRPHQRYDEWSHPPRNHQRWPGQVRQQAEWIALSFSALHDAMRVATQSSRVLTVGQQDHVSRLLEKLSVTEFIDLLPTSPEQTTRCYVSLVGAVEHYAPSLHLLFHQYALPLTQLRADGGAGAATTSAASKPKQRRSITKSDYARDGQPEEDLFVTANTVWRLLCMTGLAGEAKEAYCTTASREHSDDHDGVGRALVAPPLSATLHRPIVFSLIEQVTHQSVPSTAATLRPSSARPQPSNASIPLKGSGGIGSAAQLFDGGGVDDPGAGSLTSPLVQTVSCKTRPRTCYAQALREGRHVDLRPDTGAVCVNYTQFVKVLIRLAHAWQCQQQQQEAVEQDTAPPPRDTEEAGQEEEEEEEAASRSQGRTTSTATTASTAKRQKDGPSCVGTKPRVASAAAAPRSRRASMSSLIAPLPPPASSISSAPTRVEYEPVNYAHTLCLPYFHAFLGELLMPRLLGANRWISAAQRAMCSRPVLQLLAQHHDALVGVFNAYQRPREARGVRASLPPPYSTVLVSQLFSRVVDVERQASSGLTVGGGRSMSHAQRASLMYSLNSSMNRRGSHTVFLGDDRDGMYDGNPRGDSHALSQHRRSFASKSKRASVTVTCAAVEDNDTANDSLRASIAAAQMRDVSIVSVLQWSSVLALAKEMRWLSIRRLTESALRQCFEQVRVDAAREGDAMFYTEFLQLLCAVAYYASTNPAEPLEVKLKTFLDLYVLPSTD